MYICVYIYIYIVIAIALECPLASAGTLSRRKLAFSEFPKQARSKRIVQRAQQHLARAGRSQRAKYSNNYIIYNIYIYI